MPRYVALLSSVNVGSNQVKMADLKAALEKCGLENVSTVTASGNALFDHAKAADAPLAKLIGECVKDNFGFRTFAAVRSATELKAAIAENPFRGGSEDKFVHIHFLEKPLTDAGFKALERAHEGKGAEKFAPGSAHVHIDYVDGVGRSKVTAPFLEKHLGCMGTARNLRSLERIIEAMETR
ncbi:DUF1697 domain-containing protein [Sphingobium nicotianae]|uniref:DUF1697 domain-containing protein n=1 Tax=Sphingobium nicotianae TaxID=2782607 RepID=A0A9X1DDF0_9SPHN|nr:DUF1697 domain-containing protein [Sphingobium nicotianae]MBT2188132.1 DUF1697 domain-containing protein [Sphingobium nicotianae]